MYQRNEPPRKLIIIGALLLFVVGPLLWLAATHSFLVITANDKTATITLKSTTSNTTMTATGSYMGLVPTNTYTITTTTPTAANEQQVVARPFMIASRTIDLAAAVQSEAVTNISVDSVNVTSGTALDFIDTNTGFLEQTNAKNTLTRIGAPYTFSSVAWQSPQGGLGVATNQDTASFATIKGTAITAVPLPEPATANANLSVAYAGSSRYYVTENNKLYTYANNTLQRVAFIPSGYQLSSAAGSRVVLYQSAGTSNYNVTLLNTANGQTATTTVPLVENPIYSFSSAWSPDGTKLIISASGSSRVYDTALHVETTLQGNTSNSPVWVDNSTILYTAQNWLWHYSLDNAPSYAIAYLPKYATADAVYADQAGQYVYFTAVAGGQDLLYRAALHKQPVNVSAEKLGESNTLQASNTCSMYFMNFTALSMIAADPNDSTSCVSAIEDYLSIISVPTSTPVQVFRP